MIQVEANEANDAASRDLIRRHLKHIAKKFSEGDFAAPMLIHAQTPGVPAMRRLKAGIKYESEELERGGAYAFRQTPRSRKSDSRILALSDQRSSDRDPAKLKTDRVGQTSVCSLAVASVTQREARSLPLAVSIRWLTRSRSGAIQSEEVPRRSRVGAIYDVGRATDRVACDGDCDEEARAVVIQEIRPARIRRCVSSAVADCRVLRQPQESIIQRVETGIGGILGTGFVILEERRPSARHSILQSVADRSEDGA